MGFTPRSATPYTALSFTLAKFPLKHVYAVAYVPPMAFIVQRFRRLFAALRRLPEVVRRGRLLTSSLLTSSLSSWRPARPAHNRAVCQRSTLHPSPGRTRRIIAKPPRWNQARRFAKLRIEIDQLCRQSSVEVGKGVFYRFYMVQIIHVHGVVD